MNICEHLTSTALLFPDREAIRFEGATLTYGELSCRSQAAGLHLRSAGIREGDRVAIMLANVPAFVVWYYAALRIGAIVVSVGTRLTAAEVAHIVSDCEASAFVADGDTLRTLRDHLPGCVSVSLEVSDCGSQCDGEEFTRRGEILPDRHDADPHDPAVILYTSGTTGFPRGATLSHLNVRSNACAFNHLCDTKPHDRLLLTVPLFHCFGQNALLNSAFNAGATVILQRKFDPLESKRVISDEQVTQLYGVPLMFQVFLNSLDAQDLASVDYCFSAAAPLPIQVSEQWLQKFGLPINEGYGLTETSPFASYNHHLSYTPGTIGTPIDNVEMRVVDTETGETCLPGVPGEIVIRGPNVMLGYWNREEDTRNSIRDGWFYSGDIGRVDERGFFSIVDRVKDMISVGGLKVFPAETERVLLDHPAVADVAVVGVPDDVFGEQVVAFVVFSQDDDSDEERIAALSRHASAQLAGYKTPRLIVPIDELPRNPSGKILKRTLRELDLSAAGGGAPVSDHTQDSNPQVSAPVQGSTPARPTTPPVLRQRLLATYAAGRSRASTEFVQHLVQSMIDGEQLPEPTARFLDLGLDSLAIVDISHQIQVEVGPDHEVPATLLFDYPRICDLGDYLVTVVVSAESPDRNSPLQAAGPDENQSGSSAQLLRQQIEALSEEEAMQELMKELEE